MYNDSNQATSHSIPTRGDYRVVVRSIGQAAPASAKSIALGLGVSLQSVLDVLYRAPSVLVNQISFDLAEQMQELLTGLGYEIQVEPCSQPFIPVGEKYDIAGYITDVQAYDRVLSELGSFLGMTAADTSKLLTTPPGVILGSVSQATLTALAKRLGDGIELIASNPQTARYSVFSATDSVEQAQRTRLELHRRGYAPIANQGCLLVDLDKSEADKLWFAFQKTNTLRIINQDFLRFDVVMTEPGQGLTPEANTVLRDLIGIPEHIIPKLFTNTPITLIEALPNQQVQSTLLSLTKAGLCVRADLISFTPLALKITDTRAPRQLQRTLQSLGLLDSMKGVLPELPFQLPYALPELQARVVHSALEAAGTVAELVEVST